MTPYNLPDWWGSEPSTMPEPEEREEQIGEEWEPESLPGRDEQRFL